MDDHLALESTNKVELEARIPSAVLVKSVSSPGIDYDTEASLDINLIRWDEGDNVSPVGKTELKATMGAPSQDGNFTRKITTTPAQFYNDRTSAIGFAGWYPDSSNPNWVKEGSKVIRTDGTMAYNIDGKTDVMVSEFAQGSYQNGISPMKFQHALCLFNVYAYAVDDETKAEWGELNQVTLMNLPEQLIVNLPSDITTGKTIFSYSPKPADGKYNEYSLMQQGASKPLFAGNPTTGPECYVGTVIAGVPAEELLGIKINTKKQTESGNSISIARNFKPGYAYNIFLRLSTKGVINAEVSVTDWQYDNRDYIIDEGFNLLVNLSEYGTANSYIVSSGNRGYCFDATVKGNGVNTLNLENGKVVTLPDNDIRIQGVDSVGIIRSDAMMKLVGGKWEMIESTHERLNTKMIELVASKLSSGRVLFKVIGDKNDPQSSVLQYKGNVKIGAFDKDGNVLWSWHIWVTDKPRNQGYANGYVSLDRNLGAVTADYKNFKRGYSHWSGFYYQFGRKDPIYRPSVDDGLSSEWPINKVGHPVSVAEAHRNPVTYYFDENNAAGTNGHWTTDENSEYFWGFRSVRDDVIKTLYDPCPPGYRVPGTGIFEQFNSGFTLEKVFSDTGVPAGYTFNLGGFIKIFYPHTICIADGKPRNCDERAHAEDINEDLIFLSVATPYDPTLYDKAGEIGPDGTINPEYKNLSWHFRYSGSKLVNNSNTIVSDPKKYYSSRSSAFPVRCVLENSAPEVTDLSQMQTANSYIIPSTGFFKFRADRRGNGVTGLNVVTGPESTMYRTFDAGMGAGITGVDRVDILWWQGDLTPNSDYLKFIATNPNSDQIAQKCPVVITDKGHLRNGEVLLVAHASEETWGNVGLAAYDINDNILWTWHLWIQPGVQHVTLGDYTVMDRNLGAVYAPSSNVDFKSANQLANLGFYYQWGRKDPMFPPASMTSGGNRTSVWCKKDANGTWSVQRTLPNTFSSTIPESVKNPLAFFRQNNDQAYAGLWQRTYNVGQNSPANDFWGYVGIAGKKGESFAKTMYDPCPPGYRVMQHNVFNTANICQANDGTLYTMNGYMWTSPNAQYGVYLSNASYMTNPNGQANPSIKASGVWFPNSGYINSSGNYVYDMGQSGGSRVSTATPFYNGTTNPAILKSREMRWYRNGNSYMFRQDNDSNAQADARVVRCQME